jgi:hypothetical protein
MARAFRHLHKISRGGQEVAAKPMGDGEQNGVTRLSLIRERENRRLGDDPAEDLDDIPGASVAWGHTLASFCRRNRGGGKLYR